MWREWRAEKLLCRGFQYGVKAGMYLLPWTVPKVMRGAGSCAALPAAVKRRGLKKPLVVMGKTVRRSGLPDKMLAAMARELPGYFVFDGVTPDPSDETVESGVRAFYENSCDCIIAFGGGSAIDCAKVIAARIARPGKTVQRMQGLFRVLRPVPVLFAVPTTAGTGSETTIAAVITDSKTHHKASVTDLCLMPRFAVLDPELTAGLSPELTAATGMDALCHAVEAYINSRYNGRRERELCRKAVRLIYDNLPGAYREGNDLKAREKMQQAAFYAGRAFTRGCVGYAHAVGHALGSLYGTPHGLAVGILLPHVLRAYGKAAHRRLAELSDVCGLTRPEAGEAEKAESFIRWTERLKEQTGLPEYPEMVCPEDVKRIAQWAEREANPLYPVPKIWNRREFEGFVYSLTPQKRGKRLEQKIQEDREKDGQRDDI